MPNQLTNNPEALRMFFTEDIFLVKEPQVTQSQLAQTIHPPVFTTQSAETAAENEPNVASGSGVQSMKVPVETASDRLNNTAAPSAELPIHTEFNYVGANERNILILVNDPENAVSSIAGRQLLGLILKSIKLERNDCALVNYASYPGTEFTAFQNFFKPQWVFAFGLSPVTLGLRDTSSNTIIHHEGANLIFSSDLDALNDDPATKKLLWASLKQIELK